MDQLNAIVDSWSMMVAYLPWIVLAFFVILVFILGYIGSISGYLRDIAHELREISKKLKDPNQS
jgi:hypothetical protein